MVHGWEPIGASIERETRRPLREVLFGGMVVDPVSSTWMANDIAEGATVSLQFEPFKGTLRGHTDRVRSVAFLGEWRFASGSYDNTIKIWNTETGACERTLNGHTHHVSSLASLGNGRFASGSSDNTIKIWNTETGACERTLNGHTQSVSESQM